jgi:hypothetical protein
MMASIQYNGGGRPALGQSPLIGQSRQPGSLRRQVSCPCRRSNWLARCKSGTFAGSLAVAATWASR